MTVLDRNTAIQEPGTRREPVIMKILYTENELLALGMIYDYSSGVIVVWNIYDKTRTIFVREGQMWRKAGKLDLAENESLHEWVCSYEIEYARADSAHGEIISVTYVDIRWKYDRNALPGLQIPIYRKVIEKAPTKYYLRHTARVEAIQLSAEEVAALEWVKY